MANRRFDENPAAAALTGDEVIPGMQDGVDVQMTAQDIADLASTPTSVTGNAGTATALATARTIDGVSFNGTANITVIAPATNAASSKAVPVDADKLALVDSEASNVLKHLTWVNLKAALKAPVLQAVTSSATVTPAFGEDLVKITAQAAGITLANPSGTAVPGWGFVIRIKDNGTSRAISYDTQYRAIGVELPTATVISKTLYLGCIWNADDTKLDVLAVGQEE